MNTVDVHTSVATKKIPQWAIFEHEVIWESVNKKWRLERNGNFNHPTYEVIGNGEVFPYSFRPPYTAKQQNIPHYVQKALNHLREDLSKEVLMWNDEIGWIVVNRWEGSPLTYIYTVYLPFQSKELSGGKTFIKERDFFVRLTDHMKNHLSCLSNEEIYQRCYALIKQAFPEIDTLKKVNQERGQISGQSY